MEIERVEVINTGRCRCCGRRIKAEYRLCIEHERKRMRIVNDCLGAGMNREQAWAKAEAAYPQVFK